MIRRTIHQEIAVPYSIEDDRYKELTDVIVAQTKRIDDLEEKFKAPLKDAKEKRDEAIKELSDGKDDEIECFLYIDVKKCTARLRDAATGELLEDRKATDMELQPQMDDLEVEKEIKE
jgi:hypothetical protein